MFEKRFPGRTACEGVTCKNVMGDGNLFEVVIARSMPDGEFELRSNQADEKYHSLVKSTQFTEEEMQGIDGMDDIASEHEKMWDGSKTARARASKIMRMGFNV